MEAPPVICYDYESFPIRQRPDYPPKPVGVAIRWPGEAQSTYWGFGHPEDNNCDEATARAQLEKAWRSGLPLLAHNQKFDYAVATEAWGLPLLPWQRLEDSMFLAYLDNPHSRALGLKELARDILGWNPDERDELADWILSNGAALVARHGGKKPTKKSVGEWIWAAPGDLVGRYACGDTDRTLGLFKVLWPSIQDLGMGPAYDRERQLMPILMQNEREGMRADVAGLKTACFDYSLDMETVEEWLRRELRASGLNFDSDADVSDVLFRRGIVPQEAWQTTKSGKLSMSKENLLPEHFAGENGDMIAAALGYRNRLTTCLSMFMEPWLDQAQRNGGYVTTNWNQTRGGDAGGTRTGRPSTNKHNFLNVSKSFEGRDDQYRHPDFLDVSPLPLCREFILPDEGDMWLHRDFSSQELRIFAHFESGDLWHKYHEDPQLDVHVYVGSELMRVAGREIERTRVKTLNFQSLYGGGVPALQRKLRCSLAEGKELKEFHNKALPGRVILNEEIKKVINQGLPIRTIGGRLYLAEPPGADGRNKLYKLINYEVQGSAADYTKQSIIDWHAVRGNARFLISVYDENNISAPIDRAAQHMRTLREVMDAPRLGLTVPMLSDGKYGPAWGKLTKGEPA